jgi:glycosyltransferase involved in cell wall biosynthesis
VKILIISDAWFPQVNGVVRTLEATAKELARLGHETRIVGPDQNRRLTFALRFYPEIKLEFFAYRRLKRVLREFQPDFIHIATEGPLGWAARRLCLSLTLPFTTAYHTRFPEYLAARAPLFLGGFLRMTAYALLRRFHAPASVVMVATASIEQELRARRFRRLVRWSRGVDTHLFRPYGKDLAAYADLPRPVLLYVGRISVEKNLRAFLDVGAIGSQIVIGDGPDLASLQKQYPDAHFLGALSGENLARHYAAADLFVFPSTTDTFGLVLLEAAAAGLRIAAVPAPGPSDIFADGAGKGFVAMDQDLSRAIATALHLPDDSNAPRAFAQRFTWEACTEHFFAHLQAPTPKAVRRLTRWRERIARI